MEKELEKSTKASYPQNGVLEMMIEQVYDLASDAGINTYKMMQ